MCVTMGKLEFEVDGSDFVKLGNESVNIQMKRNINPSRFIEIFERIASKFGFSITEEFHKTITTLEFRKQDGKKIKYRLFGGLIDIIDFFINCDILLGKNIGIEVLVNEFRKSGNNLEFEHACSLSHLTSNYALNGYTDIEFGGRTDFSINQIPAELKVIHRFDPDKRFDERGGNEFYSYVCDDVCYDIGQAVSNRLPEAIRQSAEVVFIDLSKKSLSGLYAYAQHKKAEISSTRNILPEPRKHRVIFFCKVSFSAEPTSFFGTYIDFEPRFWNYLKPMTKKKKKHTRVGSPKLKMKRVA